MIDEFSIEEGNNLLIVDSLNYAFKYKHKNIKNFTTSFINDMRSFAKSYKADEVVILGDGGSTYRKALHPDYKISRRNKYTEDEQKEFEDFLEEYSKTLVMIEEFYPIIKFNGVEADDIAAYIVKYYKNKYDNICLLSTDKDWDLLIDKNVIRFGYVTRKEITIENFEDHYGYKQEDHISIKVLQGDRGDDIAGVAGVGEKRAFNFIKQYGSAFDLYSALPIEGANQYTRNLNNSGDLILLNYDLMDLLSTCEVAIGADNIKIIKGKMND